MSHHLAPDHPVPPPGAAATAGVLCAGLLAFKQVRGMRGWGCRYVSMHADELLFGHGQGNAGLSQQMMRARVAFQVRH